jgi:hypothetical protein
MSVISKEIGYEEVVPRDIHFKMNTDTVARHWLSMDHALDELHSGGGS